MRRISKLSKNARGFTLVEVLLVVGIIIILAGSFALGINDLLGTANRGKTKMSESGASLTKSINDSEAHLSNLGF